jgi:hypothetical protein
MCRKIGTLDILIPTTVCYLLRTTMMDAKWSRLRRCRPNNDSDEALKQNYATLIGVISLTCPDALFEGIYNYLQMIKDDELLK